jgi:hypothetical protein
MITGCLISVGSATSRRRASFDFGFGHYVDGKSWAELAREYNLTAGRVWIAILVWFVVGPVLMEKLHGRRSRSVSGRRLETSWRTR